MSKKRKGKLNKGSSVAQDHLIPGMKIFGIILGSENLSGEELIQGVVEQIQKFRLFMNANAAECMAFEKFLGGLLLKVSKDFDRAASAQRKARAIKELQGLVSEAMYESGRKCGATGQRLIVVSLDEPSGLKGELCLKCPTYGDLLFRFHMWEISRQEAIRLLDHGEL